MTTKKKIDYQKILTASDPVLSIIEKTYTGSFPETERRTFALVRDLIEKNAGFTVYAFFNEGKYIGFITTWQFESFTYIEHFAIDKPARNGGFGSSVMKWFIEKFSSPIILEAELPENDISMRRIGFYERIGFKPDNHYYEQPPYHPNGEWLPMLLMYYGNLDMSHQTFEQIKQTLYRFVYNTD
jgi:GNAT superfamily N-acetyltransferase